MPHPAVAVCWHAPAAGESRVRYRRRGTPSWIALDPAAAPAPGSARRRSASAMVGADGGQVGSGGDGGGAGGGAAAGGVRHAEACGLGSVVVWEGLAAASEYEVQVRVGPQGAWGRSAWARTGGAEECPRAAGRALVATLGLAAAFFDSEHDRCYCGACYKAEWPDAETDGPRPYVIPRGWARFGLKLHPRAEALGREFFRTWCVGFHGAAAGVCKQILESGGMLIPGDRLLDGGVLRSGRCAGRQARKYYTSPSVRYAGLRFYAAPTRFVDAAGRDMLGQVSAGGRALELLLAVQVIEWDGDGRGVRGACRGGAVRGGSW